MKAKALKARLRRNPGNSSGVVSAKPARGSVVIALGLSILLAVVGVWAFPCWRHSARWGHGPSVVAGVLLLVVAAAAASNRPFSLLDSGRVAPPLRVEVAEAANVRVAATIRPLQESGPP